MLSVMLIITIGQDICWCVTAAHSGCNYTALSVSFPLSTVYLPITRVSADFYLVSMCIRDRN